VLNDVSGSRLYLALARRREVVIYTTLIADGYAQVPCHLGVPARHIACNRVVRFCGGAGVVPLTGLEAADASMTLERVVVEITLAASRRVAKWYTERFGRAAPWGFAHVRVHVLSIRLQGDCGRRCP
jgi:hypothetical protein